MRTFLVLLVALASASARYFGNYQCDGGRDVIVHLFEWKWTDIQATCPRLAQLGYCAVQVSPPEEHVVLPNNNPPYPWWQRYQPVSYIVTSRSGNEQQFQSMVNACNSVGVKIYVDAIVNHMSGGGSGIGSAGSSWDGGSSTTNVGQSYPGVPYGANDFNGADMCSTGSGNIENYGDANQVRNCRLSGLRDLRLSTEWPRQKIREYMDKLISWGVSGFRVDATKHMWPGDAQAIYDGLSSTPFIFQEVIDQGGEPITAGEYTGIGRVTEFKYSTRIGDCVLGSNGQKLAYLSNFGEGWGFMNGMDAVVFIDNHDNQRGHGGGGTVLTHKQPRDYKIANAFMLAWQYGYTRVMSSFSFSNADAGPPSDGNGNTNDVTCFNGDWVCEHEWRQIYNMVKFHNAAVGQPVTNWYDNGNMLISFGRGNVGYLVINKEGYDINQSFQTGLPAGQYCDIISCDTLTPPCGGSECQGAITVDGSGWAQISISSSDADPMRAYMVGA